MFIKVTSAQSLTTQIIDVSEIASAGRNYSGEKVSIKFKMGGGHLYIKESEEELFALLDSAGLIHQTPTQE